jgi:hypothetical protein
MLWAPAKNCVIRMHAGLLPFRFDPAVNNRKAGNIVPACRESVQSPKLAVAAAVEAAACEGMTTSSEATAESADMCGSYAADSSMIDAAVA